MFCRSNQLRWSQWHKACIILNLSRPAELVAPTLTDYPETGGDLDAG
jgi:hypothetical protein